MFKKLLGIKPNKPISVYENIGTFRNDWADNKYHITRREFSKYISTIPDVNASRIMKDTVRLAKGPGKITFEDYVLFRLFEHERLSADQQMDFVSDSLHWNIVDKIGDTNWQIATEDKFLCYSYLQSFGLPVPETVAVIDPGNRNYGNVPAIRNQSDWEQFLRSSNTFPFFVKPNLGIGSYGAAIICGLVDDKIDLDLEEPISFIGGFEKWSAGGANLIQKKVRNHADLEKFTSYLATVRLTNFITDREILTPFALLKLPSKDSIADNYWRKGNMLANINPNTGALDRLVRGKGLTLEVLQHHPDSDEPLLGEKLPFWNEVIALNRQCVRCFEHIKFQSTDIAITPNGPMIIEVNTGGSFELHQLASGRGLLTNKVRKFFVSHGLTQFA